MCGPAALPIAMAAATAAVGVGSAALQYSGEKKAYKQNTQAANENFRYRTEALGAEEVQTRAASAEDALSATIRAAQEAGRISASASDMGVAGDAATHLQGAAAVTAGREQSINDLNLSNTLQQLTRERRGADIERRSQINSLPKASLAKLGLGVAKAGIQAAGTYQDFGGKF